MTTSTTTLFFLLLLLPLFFLPFASSQVATLFAFGDSTLDSGNNNANPLTLLRADHPPYGRDFPGSRPTGRFTDGKLITDFLLTILGSKDRLPAYLDPSLKDSDLPTGVSFASAGSGLDDVTAVMVNVIPMGKQLGYFKEYMGRLERVVGKDNATNIVGSAMFAIGAGSNDMMMNYYLNPDTHSAYSLTQYHHFLLGKLHSFVQQLHQLGARKFLISGMPPIGCLPFTISAHNLIDGSAGTGCVTQQNEDAVKYNTKLATLISDMKTSLLNDSFVLNIDSYTTLMDMINNSTKYGFENVKEGCCGSGSGVVMGPLCNDEVPICDDPTKYLFWDAVHPSQSAYQAMIRTLMPTITTQLAALNTKH